jgi:hypothetical protein
MSADNHIPKVQVLAGVIREGRPPETFKLFLAERTDRHAGCERMGEMLNGSRVFVPVVDTRGGLVFLRRDAIRMVVLSAAEHPDETLVALDGGGEVMAADVDIVFHDGQVATGVMRYVARGEHRRIQDHLNGGGHFLVLESRDQVTFVNTLHVLEVSLRRRI